MISLFESDVISDGTQTGLPVTLLRLSFESDVISDGTQTADAGYPKAVVV